MLEVGATYTYINFKTLPAIRKCDTYIKKLAEDKNLFTLQILFFNNQEDKLYAYINPAKTFNCFTNVFNSGIDAKG